MPDIRLSKEKIRNKFLNLRLKLAEEKVNIKSAMIALKLQKMDCFENAKGVLLYMPIKNEVETKYIFSYLVDIKKTLFLPAFNKTSWCISKYRFGDDLISGPFNIGQPKKIDKAHINDCDIAVVPGLAFSQNGFRVGYGKGIYDQLLISSTCIKIGLCYDFQIIKHLDSEDRDIPMDKIVSEKRIINLT